MHGVPTVIVKIVTSTVRIYLRMIVSVVYDMVVIIVQVMEDVTIRHITRHHGIPKTLVYRQQS